MYSTHIFIRDDGKRKRKFCVYSRFLSSLVYTSVHVCVSVTVSNKTSSAFGDKTNTSHIAHFIGLRCPDRRRFTYRNLIHSIEIQHICGLNCSLCVSLLYARLNVHRFRFVRRFRCCWTELKTWTTICRIYCTFYNGFDLLQIHHPRRHTHSHVIRTPARTCAFRIYV